MNSYKVQVSEPEKIPGKVLGFLENHDWDMKSFCEDITEDVSDFEYHVRYYIIDESPDELWKGYTDTNPLDMWQGPMANFAVMYDPSSDEVHTGFERPVPSIAADQIIFLYLNIDKFIRRSSAVQMSEINHEKRRIVLSYLKQNATHGKQEITLEPIGSGEGTKTLVRHQAWFRGTSKFFDKFLYPPFHARIIDEYHRQIASTRGSELEITTIRKLRKKGLPAVGQSL